jgi:hypothetical protein
LVHISLSIIFGGVVQDSTHQLIHICSKDSRREGRQGEKENRAEGRVKGKERDGGTETRAVL